MSLEKNLEEIEALFLAKRSFLLKAKMTMFVFGTMGVLFVHMKLAGYRKPLPDWEIYLGDGAVAFLIYSSIIFIPLYKFFEDRILLKMVWDIKTAIIKNTLLSFTNDYHISFKGLLPEEDIKDLKLQNGFLQFCYGDDLIFGMMNGKRFRISEMHSVSPFKRNFDGIIGVVLFDKPISPEFEKQIQQFISSSNPANTLSVKTLRNKVFLSSKGRKQHFELRIKNNRANRDDLNKDYSEFRLFIETLNGLSHLK